jgi:hypothetical protein
MDKPISRTKQTGLLAIVTNPTPPPPPYFHSLPSPPLPSFLPPFSPQQLSSMVINGLFIDELGKVAVKMMVIEISIEIFVFQNFVSNLGSIYFFRIKVYINILLTVINFLNIIVSCRCTGTRLTTLKINFFVKALARKTKIIVQ